jgi:hypothetical protein
MGRGQRFSIETSIPLPPFMLHFIVRAREAAGLRNIVGREVSRLLIFAGIAASTLHSILKQPVG